MGDYLTTSEVCAVLSLGPARVKQLRLVLGAIKPGRDLLYPRARVLAYRDSPRPGPGYPKGRPRKPAAR